MHGRFRFPVLIMLKRSDVIVGSRMFTQVWRRVGQVTAEQEIVISCVSSSCNEGETS